MKYKIPLLKRPKSNLKKISDFLPEIRENLGIEDQAKINVIKEVWPLITSFKIAESSTPAYFDNSNNLVIAVKNPSLATELSMQKLTILKKLRSSQAMINIGFKDIRFIVRS